MYIVFWRCNCININNSCQRPRLLYFWSSTELLKLLYKLDHCQIRKTNKQINKTSSTPKVFVKLVLSGQRGHSPCVLPVASIRISTLILGSKNTCTFYNLLQHSYTSPNLSISCAMLTLEPPLHLYECSFSYSSYLHFFPWYSSFSITYSWPYQICFCFHSTLNPSSCLCTGFLSYL